MNLPDGNVDGGLPASADQVIPGESAPGVVVGVSVEDLALTTIQLSWAPAYAAADYQILYQSLINVSNAGIASTTVDTTDDIAFLFPGTWHYSFCVQPYNGNLIAACSAYVTPPVYPGYNSAMISSDAAISNLTNSDGTAGVKVSVNNPLEHTLNGSQLMSNSGLQKLWQYKTHNGTGIPS